MRPCAADRDTKRNDMHGCRDEEYDQHDHVSSYQRSLRYLKNAMDENPCMFYEGSLQKLMPKHPIALLGFMYRAITDERGGDAADLKNL